MSVWFCLPSKREYYAGTLEAWRDMGYKVAIIREAKDGQAPVDLVLNTSRYQGWARSTNLVIGAVMAARSDAQWFVGGGDDYMPDPNKRAIEIAGECDEHFIKLWDHREDCPPSGAIANHSFGVMQPTGDRWGEKNGEAIIDRIAGSPWLGREFCRRMYHGAGPLYNGYFHNFADEELQCVAQKLDVFWRRRDVNQEHRHWARPRGSWDDAPEWAHAINHPVTSDWERSKALFAKRKAAGFPGHEPLEL